MGNPQGSYINFSKMAKSVSEKEFKTLVDKSWLPFHAEIGRINPEFKKTKKADFLVYTRVARDSSQEDFIKWATGETENPTVKLKPDEAKSLRASMELFVQLIPVMDGQFGCDWFIKQKDTPAPAPAATKQAA